LNLNVTDEDLDLLQEADTFLFVSPENIAQFAGKFVESRPEYDALVDQLVKNIKGEDIDEPENPDED